MLTPGMLVQIFWLIFLITWIVSAGSAKRTVRNKTGRQRVMIRLIMMVVVVGFFHWPGDLGHPLFLPQLPHSMSVRWIGALLCGAGIAFAIWARVYLGRNWGMPMSLKENPELVTGGPYRFVRHPIYTGLLVAIFGSALVGHGEGMIMVILFLIYFIYSAMREERLMTEQFPLDYLEYKKRTKMLVPFLI